MTYQEWIENHYQKHQTIIKQISHLTKDEIIAYFDFENMKKLHEDFCLLYPTNTKCHDLKKLNCYICGCPYFRVNDKKSYCSINSRKSAVFIAPDGFEHLDCSNCTLPHTTKFVTKNFELDWINYIKEG